MKVKKFFIGLVIFFVMLALVYVLHIKFFKVNVIFYNAIFDGVLASVLTFLILLKWDYFRILNIFEKFQMGFSFVLLGYIFAISVPTVIDRSLSFYILEKLQQRGGGIKESGFKEVFQKEYMPEDRLVDVRLTEQLASGTIVIKNGCVKLTKKGYDLAKFSSFFRHNLLPKKRLLMGKYTSDLTDPFGHGAVDSNKTFDYICK